MSVGPISNTVPNVDTDGVGGHYLLAEMMGLDGQGNRQQMNVNQDLIALQSEARTAQALSALFTNQNGRGCLIFLNITAASGTGGLQLAIYGIDPASGESAALYLDTVGRSSIGLYCFSFYPGTLASNGLIGLGECQLPRNFQVGVIPKDSSSYTYSVGVSVTV